MIHWALAFGALAFGAGCTCRPPPRTAIPTLRAPAATGALSLDGRLDEPCWERAAETELFVDPLTGEAGAPRARARVTWNDEALWVGFDVEDDFLHCSFQGHDAHLWEQDAVELMIDPDGDGRSYVELQVSPTNLAFDTWFDARRTPPPFGHASWSSGLRSSVHVRGVVNDEVADQGYTVEIAIPWSAFAAIGTPAPRPRPGDTWRIAMYVLDARPGGGQNGVGWSPPLVGDFHVPDRFGRVVFER
jgi:hypothetical protein